MRRTTICRSSRAVLLALVARLLGVPGLGAQDTTRAAADTSQAPAAPAGQVPESHVVTRGETLWSISQLYFSDPLLWPEIYRLNTAVVEDPHWIYPGEVLHLAAPTSVAQVQAETTAVSVAQAVAAIPRLTQHTTATVFGEISIQPPSNASYHVGDSLLIARVDRDVPSWGDVVVPVGVARVTDVQKRQLLGDVIMQFGRIHDGNLAMPLEPFKDAGEVRPVPVARGLEASVIAQRDLHVLTNAQQILFLNKGRSEGVVPGDLFEIYRPASGQLGAASEQPLIVVEIVHTREHSCSGLVLGITHPGVFPGSPARLIRKMPS